MKRYVPLLFLILSVTWCFGQQDRETYDHIHKGNKLYTEKAYKQAETEYLKADSLDGNSFEAAYNLGEALYRQDSLSRAAKEFERAANLAQDRQKQSRAYHNLGNAYLKKKEYQKSIDAYKEALRRNPGDDETRYNLIYARKMLDQQKKQQQQKKDQNKNQKNKDQNKQENKDNQDNNKGKQDQKNKDNGSQNKEKQGDQKQDQQAGDKGKDKKEKQAGKEQGTLSKQEADKLLNALDQEEEELRKSIRIKEENTKPKYIEKNW